MKKITISILLQLLFISFAYSQGTSENVCVGDLTLSSQAAVDAFDCTEITGNLMITGSDITNLNALSGLRSVGTLFIQSNMNLSNLDGFNALTKGNLFIDSNESLESIKGFQNITMSVIRITDNSKLSIIEGFSSLNSITGELFIEGNPELSDIHAFESLSTITREFHISGSKLANLESFSSLRNVGSLFIGGNNDLINLDALNSLISVTSSSNGLYAISIINNARLTNVDGLRLPGNQAIASIEIHHNEPLESINGFSSLTKVNGYLNIHHNPSLISINGFNRIEELHDRPPSNATLSITDNNSLTNIDGLSSLKIIIGNSAALRIINNNSLTNVDGLNSFNTIDGTLSALNISNNPNLRNLNGLSSFSHFNWGTSGSILIENNATLENIDGLSSLNGNATSDPITIRVTQNPLLTRCCGLATFLQSLGTEISEAVINISENGAGCTLEDILAGGQCQQPNEDKCADDLTGQPDATSIVLKWTPYSGTQTVTEYRVKRNGADIGSTIGKYGYFTDHGLSPGTSYSYLIEGFDENSNRICKSDSINVTTTSQSTIRTHYNLLAIAFNPQSGMESELNHIRTFLKYRLDFLKYASQNSVNLDVYNSDITIINAYPPLKPNSTSVDYTKLASTIYPELGNNTIVDLIESYDIDIVWVVGTPIGHDFGENTLMGNSNLGNDTWISEKVKCSRSFFIHGFLPDGRAFDAAAHHVEGTMTSATEKSPTNWPRDKEYLVYTKDRASYATSPEKLNLFEQFRLTDEWNGTSAYASKGNANCGSSHFVPGSIRNSVNYPDYTYYDIEAWKRYVDCFADDWLSYPNFSDKSRKINGYDFGAFNNYQENTSVSTFAVGSFHYWWFDHIPHNPGVTDGKLNNWWPYVYDCNRFDGNFIQYPVDGFPVPPITYTPINDEYGTEETSNTNWMFWHTFTDFGQRADLSIINKIENPEYVKNGQLATKVDVDIESFSINGRNDLIYPSFKNAHWQFSTIDSIIFSVKFNSQDRIRGTNPIIRLCKNGNNRIEFVPKKNDLYVNLFNDDVLKDSSGWYTFHVPVAGNNLWERNVIGFIDPALSASEQELVKLQIVSEILKDVNYFEISIQSDGGRGESLVYYIDNLKVHNKDTANATQSISSFSLINGRTGDVILDFYDSITLDIGNPDFTKWTIQANALPDTVGSVVFTLDKKFKQTENVFPYTLREHVLSFLEPGLHTLTADVYSKAHKRGERGISKTATINIIYSAAILNFDVVDTSGKVLMDLHDGDTINIKDPAFKSISIIANTTTENVGSVKFWLNHRKYSTENQAPYALNGDYGGYFNPWKAKAGDYTLVAIPYSWKWGLGYAGEALKVHFKVIDKEICNEINSKVNVANARVYESMEHQSEEIFLSLFPVPVADELYIKIDKEAGNRFNVTIRNIQGQSVHAETYSSYQLQNTSIPTAGWQSGIYYMQILGNNGFGKIVKFVKK